MRCNLIGFAAAIAMAATGVSAEIWTLHKDRAWAVDYAHYSGTVPFCTIGAQGKGGTNFAFLVYESGDRVFQLYDSKSDYEDWHGEFHAQVDYAPYYTMWGEGMDSSIFVDLVDVSAPADTGSAGPSAAAFMNEMRRGKRLFIYDTDSDDPKYSFSLLGFNNALPAMADCIKKLN